MRTLQDYKNIYREIATNLNLQGDSVEMIIQLLSYASYIEENENIVYSQESSLERATLTNSKIQLCVNEMYSVFRGQCPRVILNIQPQKYFNFQPFDEIISSNNFKIYYLGWLESAENTDGSDRGILMGDGSAGEREVAKDLGGNYVYHYGGKVVNPADYESNYSGPYQEDLEEPSLMIIGLLAPRSVNVSWTLDNNNLYYVDCLEEFLSNDMYVEVVEGGNTIRKEVTRNFSEHVLDNYLFDLTLPSYGSRLYTGKMDPSTVIDATYYVFSRISDYNTSELRKINLRGAQLIEFEDNKWNGIEEFIPGLVFVDAVGSDDLNTIHYKAYRDRFVNTIIRSNSDIGELLKEAYPNKVGDTSYEFEMTEPSDLYDINIYYVPQGDGLTSEDISNYKNTRGAYYVTKNLNIEKGIEIQAIVNVDLELYKSSDNVSTEVVKILQTYNKKFNIKLDEEINDMKSLISKISEVKCVNNLSIVMINPDTGELVTDDYIDYKKTYFSIDYTINTTITTTS